VNAVTNHQFPETPRQISSDCTTGGLQNSAQFHLDSVLILFSIRPLKLCFFLLAFFVLAH
jgi:hypothetical protein